MAKPARVPYPTSSSKRVNPTKQPHLWHQLQQLPEGHIAQQARRQLAAAQCSHAAQRAVNGHILCNICRGE